MSRRSEVPASSGSASAAADESACLRAIDSLGEWVAVVDRKAQTVRWASRALGSRFPEFLSGCSLEGLIGAFPGIEQLWSLKDGVSRRVHVAHRGDGLQLDIYGVGRDETGGAYVDLRIADASERRHAEQRHLADRERLLSVSRTMSIAEMASTLAHELNQPIGAIANLLRGMQARIQRKALAPEALDFALARALEQTLYASGIVARIREYVHARQPRRGPIDLTRVTRGALELLDWEIERDSVRVVCEFADSLPPALGDEVMVQQVVVNLVRNGIEAMRDTEHGQRELSLTAALDADGAIELCVCDSGVGMTDEGAELVFTPLFTTKPDGTGIGLNLCRSIAELHHGRLWFTRNRGRGCTFHLTLPIAVATATASA